MQPTVNWKPRKDYVVMRLVKAGQTPTGIALPDTASEGVQWYVTDVGPDVEGLKRGDRVEPMGTIDQDIARVPGTRDLFLTKEANIPIVAGKG